MLVLLSLLISTTYALTESDRDLVAAHLCFSELDRYTVKGREIIPRSKGNIRQIARTEKKTNNAHWAVNDYAVWTSEEKKLQYVSIKTNIKPKSPAYEIKVLTGNSPPLKNTDKLVLTGGKNGSSCPIGFDTKKGVNTRNAKLFQVAVAYEDCSDIHEAVELAAELDESNDELVSQFEDAISWRLKALTPKVIKGLAKKRGGPRKLKKAYAKAKLNIFRKCHPVQTTEVQVGLKRFLSSVKKSFPKKRLPAAK